MCSAFGLRASAPNTTPAIAENGNAVPVTITVESPMTDALNETQKAQILATIPLRRMGRPEEVASLVAYLMSADAAYITRQVISVNGGMVG